MVTLVADAAPSVGLGHLSRSSAIAGALALLGVEVRCLAYDAPEPLERDGVVWTPYAGDSLEDEVVVLDSYLLAPADVAPRTRVALLYDGGPLPEGVDLAVAPSAARVPGPRWLGGLEHACLRREFWEPAERSVAERVERVLVTTGGGAAGDGLAQTLARAALDALPDADVAVLRGPFSRLTAPPGTRVLDAQPSLRPLLLDADLVLSAAGQTALEAAACGTPAVLVALDAFQAAQGARLAHAGAARLVEAGDVARTIHALDRAAMAAAGPAVVDCRGALRVAQAIAELSR
jgi:spore coat polysaccharide biosynthesis predicted glycosyltransferase SpsG